MKNIFLIPLSLLLIISCRKKDDDNAIPLRVKSQTDAGGSYNYTYNTGYNIVKTEFNSGFNKEEYQYEPQKITQIITDPSNTYTIHYGLNGKGLAITKQFEGSNEIQYYEYDDKGFVVRTYNNKAPRTEAAFFYNTATGLLDSVRSLTGSAWNYTSVFMYYTEIKNTLGDDNYGCSFRGKSLPHPYKAVAQRRPNGNQITVGVTSYTYTLDNKGRISNRSFITSGGQSGNDSFTYY